MSLGQLFICRERQAHVKNNIMKKLIGIIAVLTLMLVGFNQKASATHISGTDFSWTCVGQDSFLITFNIFRDCSGVSAPGSAFVNFASSCGGSTSATLVLQNGSTGTEVSQLCATSISNSTCNGGSLPGMQQYTYTGIVVLSPPCNVWTMSWSSCCRNTTVNLVGQPGTYIEATMNSGSDTCNNSPVFNAQPIPYVCINQVVNYNFGVTEPDGDSIVYSFVNPLTAANNPVPWNTGYSTTAPIPGITLNTATGQLTFTPTILGNFVLAVQACEYEYGTGILLGCVTRDIQFVVINCANNQPTPPPGGISNFLGTGVQISPDSVEVCVGNWFSFDLVFTDSDPLDSITLFSNIAAVLPGATITTTNGNPATITVGWTAVPGTAPFNSFTVTGIDDACPTPGIVTSSYNVIVVPSTYAGPDLTICQGTQWAQLGAVGGSIFEWFVVSGSAIDTVPSSPGYNMTCKNCQNPQVSPATTTTYRVVSNLSGTCVNIDTVVVNVAPNFNLTMPNDTLICSVDDYPLVISSDEPTFTYTYKWSPSSTLDYDTVMIPLANPSDPTVYSVTVTSAGGCKKKGSVFIDLSPPFPGNMEITGDTILCVGQTTQLDIDFGTIDVGSCGPTTQSCLGVVANGDLGNGTNTNTQTTYPAVYGGQHWGAKHQILYRGNELANMGMGSGGLINSIGFMINSLSLVPGYTDFTIKMGCTSEPDLSTGWVNPNDLATVYYNANYVPSTGWNNHTFTTPYKWDGTSNIVVEICFNNVGSAGNAIMPNTATGYQSVIYQFGNNPNICASLSPPGSGANLSNARPNTRFNYCAGADPAKMTFTWSPTSGLSNGIIPNPIAGPTVSTTYQVIVTDTFGACADTLEHFIDVVTQFDAGFIFNDPLCVSADPDTAFINVGGGYFTGLGVDSSGVFSPGVAGVGVHPITYTIPVPALCANDSTINVTVIDLPDATIDYDEVCVGGDTIHLSTTVAGGVFSGPGIIDQDSGIFNPLGLSAGTYNIAYTLTQPCFNSDTTGIKVIEPYSFVFNNNIVEVCQDNTVDISGNYTLSVDPNQGSGPVLAIWGDANGYIDPITGVFDATGVPQGDYVVTLEVAGLDSACGTTQAMTIRVLKIDYPTFDDLVFCDNEKNAVITVVPWLYGSGTTFTQTPLGSLDPSETLDIVQFGSNGKFDATKEPVGSWELTVSYTNLNGCTGVSTDTVHVLFTPEAPTVAPETYCEGQDINLNGIGTDSDSMYWYNDINLIDTIGVGSPTYWGVAPSASEGPVYVWVTENNWECVSPAVKYELPIKPSPNADFTMNFSDTTGKYITSLSHEDSPIYGYNPFYVEFFATNYNSTTDSVWWNHNAEAGANSGSINDANAGSGAGFVYSNANYDENGPIGDPFITQLIITNEFGCKDTAEAYIWAIGTEAYYDIFTPNGDGQNDVFFADNTTLYDYNLTVYNRWGTKVFESDNVSRGWDGGDQPEGVYFWVLIGKDGAGEEFKKQGTVTLAR